MPFYDLSLTSDALGVSTESAVHDAGANWLVLLDTLGVGSAAIGLVWPCAPGSEDLATTVGAAINRARTGYLDERTILLPWQSVCANLVLGTEVAPDSALSAQVLSVLGLSGVAARRPQGLSPFQCLVLGLGRAMLQYPELLVIRDLHRHAAAVGQLRVLTRIEAELGELTGCRRLHVVDRLRDAETFCDIFLQVKR